MGACSRAVAEIVRADVAVIGTGGAVRGIAVISGFVTGIVALRPAATGVTGVDGAGPTAADVSAVAVQAVIAGRPIRSRSGNAGARSFAAYTNVACIIQVGTVDTLARIILG